MLKDEIQDYVQRGFSLVPFRAIPPAAGETKWKKKPIVKWEDRQNKALDEKETLAEFGKWHDALIGCVTGQVSGICTLDIDDDEGRRIADELVPDSLLVPTYQTMSGGVQMIFRNPEPSIPGAVRFMPGLDYRGEGTCTILPPGSNGKGGQYRWLDGLSLREVDPPSMPSALLSAIIKESTLYRERNTCYATADKLFTNGRRDNDLFHVANCLTKGGMPAEEIAQVLENLIISWGEKPDSKWISDKVESAKKRDSRRSGDVTKAIEEWVSVTDGYFSVTDCSKALQSVTDSEHTTFRVILHRLAKRGIIEKHGQKDGVYRRLDNEIEPLDWRNADIKPLDLIQPFGIHNLVNLYAGNTAIIAGAPNSGKTAFIHNFIRLNQDKHRIHLFSSEGGKEELRQRLSKFNYPLDSWKFEAWDRSGDFADVIKPDDINIIDYLEIHDEFYKIGGIIKSISDRLKSGFALIALQKNNGRDEGLGGARGLEKPRLYMSMDSGRLKIVKAKSWVNSANNPNGQFVRFKLVDGCNFKIESKWERE
jgi:hypothetical protein